MSHLKSTNITDKIRVWLIIFYVCVYLYVVSEDVIPEAVLPYFGGRYIHVYVCAGEFMCLFVLVQSSEEHNKYLASSLS